MVADVKNTNDYQVTDELTNENEDSVVHETDFYSHVVLSMTALSEGLSHLATLAITYLFKDDLNLSPSQISLLLIASAFPWFLKPLFAFYSDSYTLFNMRRKPYLIFFSIMQSLGFILLAFGVKDILGAVLSLFIVSFSASFSSAISEALLVELTSGTRQEAANLISRYTTLKATGSFIVAYLSGYLIEAFSKQLVFLITAIFPLMITGAAIFMVDVKPPNTCNVNQQLLLLSQFLKQRIIWGPCIFILAFISGPDYDDALFFYYTNVLGLNPTFMGTLRFTYSFAAILSAILYQIFLSSKSYRKVLFTSILISLPIYLSPIILVTGLNLKLGINDKIFVLSGGFLNEAVAEIQQMPLLILTSCISPKGLEGSAFSIMSTVRNLGSAVSRATSAVAMNCLDITAHNFKNLVLYIWICGLFNLLPFSFISFIPTDKDIHEASKNKDIYAQEILPPVAPRKALRVID